MKTPEKICAGRRHIKTSGGHMKFPVTKMPGTLCGFYICFVFVSFFFLFCFFFKNFL